MATNVDYSGSWHVSYWFPSNTSPGSEEASEYDAVAQQTGHELVVQSKPNDDGSYILTKLVIDGIFAAGSWTENTAPQGEFAGSIYSGVVQLIISDDHLKMTGLWTGVGRDHEKQQADIYSGRFELTRIN